MTIPNTTRKPTFKPLTLRNVLTALGVGVAMVIGTYAYLLAAIATKNIHPLALIAFVGATGGAYGLLLGHLETKRDTSPTTETA